MRLRTYLLPAACGAALLSPPGVAAVALPACAGKQASGLTFERAVGAQEGTLAWQIPPGPRPESYMVYRDRRLVGETAGRSITVEVRAGRKYEFSVRAVGPAGALSECVQRLRQTVRFYRPPAPAGLAVTKGGGGTSVVWSPSRPGDARIAGYRVYRDGRLFKRVRQARVSVSAAGRQHSYRVAAADSLGNLGPQSRSVRVLKSHDPPGRPGRLRARAAESKVRLSWTAARRKTGRIAGYRIYRGGDLVRQVRGLGGSDDGLAAGARYRFTVAAVDTQGYMSAAAAPVSVKTAKPAATRGRAHAFLLASTGESFRDLQRHYRQIGTVYPTYFECRADGTVAGHDDPLITQWAQLRGIQVLPRFDCQRPSALHTILTDPEVRAATTAAILALVREQDYEGINIDMEQGSPDDRDALTVFVSDLATRLHAAGRRISVEVSAKYEPGNTGRAGFYDYPALGRAADRVFVMNWGWHWATSEPGAPDDLELCRRVADYVATMPNKGRFVLATHLYGMDWPAGGGPSNQAAALEFSDVRTLIARYGVQPVLDPQADAWVFGYTDAAGVHHEVWYPDAATLSRRVRLARDRGLGIGFWRLGKEDQALWDNPWLAPGSSWP